MLTMLRGLALSTLQTYTEMAPYLLLGLTFAGLLHVVFKKEFITRHLGKDSLGSVVKAALLGVPLPLCSCGVVPTALSLRKSSASKGATMSFLISTPQTGVDSIIATYGMLGPVFALFRPLAAFLIGVVGGAVAHATGTRRGETQGPAKVVAGCADDDAAQGPWFQRLVFAMRYGYVTFLDDISVQLLIGIAISGLITFFVPGDFFERFVGNDLAAMALMILGGVPLYVCATASIPIAAALMAKGVSPGVAFVFLAVGPATNAASLTIIAQSLGKKFAATYLAVMIVGAVLAGYALNFAVALFGTGVSSTHVHMHGTDGPGLLNSVWIGLFSVLLVLSFFRKAFPKAWYRIALFVRNSRFSDSTETAFAGVVIGVQGMTCNHCAAHVSEAIGSVAGVTGVQVDLNAKRARVQGTFSLSAVADAVRAAGYTPVQ